MALPHLFKSLTGSGSRGGATRRKGPGQKTRSLAHADATPGGVFVSASAFTDHSPSSIDESSQHSDSSISSHPPSWKSSGKPEHHAGSPLIVSDPESNVIIRDEAQALGAILNRARNLPDTWYFASNHVLVNQERTKRSVAPLVRSKELDEIACQHAKSMAAAQTTFHINPLELQHSFMRPARRFGENVARGKAIRDIHETMMDTRSQRNNIIDRRFTHMGMGTAKDAKGQLYLCQLFRG